MAITRRRIASVLSFVGCVSLCWALGRSTLRPEFAITPSKSAAAPLDPVIHYSTYLGNDLVATSYGAADSAGNVCAGAGSTVTKLDPDGKVIYSLVQSGWLAWAAATDSHGNCYIAGLGTITTTAGAFQNSAGSNQFVMKVDPSGAVVYATYVGGSGSDNPAGLAVDGSGNVYLAGSTTSNDFPTVNAVQRTIGGGNDDGFLAVVNATGTGLIYATYLGGSSGDQVNGVAADSTGHAYVVGSTSSTDFPTHTPIQATLAGTRNAFVAKLDPTGAFIYSTYLGGTGASDGEGIAADTNGSAYVSGIAGDGFPLTNPLQAANGPSSGFVAKLNGSGVLQFSTYLGSDVGGQVGIAVDINGQMYVAGLLMSPGPGGGLGLPEVSPIQQTSQGGQSDFFVSVIDPTGATLVFSTPLGGPGEDRFPNVSIDGSGNIYLAGTTNGSFPILNAENGTYDLLRKPCQNPVCMGQQPVLVKILLGAGVALAYPTAVDFRPQPTPIGGTSPAASILLANPNSATNIVISKIEVTAGYSLSGNCVGTLPAGGDCELMATFTPTAGGPSNGTVTITDNAPGSPHVINLLGATLTPTMDLQPLQLSFASQAVGTTSAVQPATLTNTGGAALTISNVAVTADFNESNNCGLSLQAGSSCVINVTFAPTATGARTGTLTVSDGSGNQQTVALSGTGITGSGGSSALGLSPAAGSGSATVAAGQTANYTFSIGGTGVAGTANLTCTGTPKGATCSIPASQVVSASAAAAFNVSVTTTSRTMSAANLPASSLFASVGVIAVIGMALWPTGFGKRRVLKSALWIVLISAMIFQVSCGGGSSSSGSSGSGGSTANPNGTPAGTYTLTVQAVLGSTTNSSTISLVVQ
jgi:hypothetical protein